MRKQWAPVIHRDYNYSLRHLVVDSDRYPLSVAIWEQLIEVDDPTAGATPTPNRPGRFTIEIMGYLITFEVPVDAAGNLVESASEIKLLPIAKA